MGKKNSKSKKPDPYGYFSAGRSAVVKLYPFSYIAQPSSDTESRFVVGGRSIKPSDFETGKKRFEINTKHAKVGPVDYKDMPLYPALVSDKGEIIIGRILHEYILTDRFKSSDTPFLAKLGLTAMSSKTQGLYLQVDGTNASLGLNFESHYFEGPPPQEEGMGEYLLYGAKEHRKLLLKGVGHVAHRAAVATSA